MAGSRVVLNRSRLDAVQLGIGDGIAAWAAATIGRVNAPDGPPFGEGLPNQWGYAVYVNGKKIADASGDGTAVSPPRAAKISRQAGLSGLIGWGFPARFNELGTSKMDAQPFFAKAVLAAAPQLPEFIRGAVPR